MRWPCGGDMWCPCPYSDCDAINTPHPSYTGGMGSFPVIHGFLPLSSSSSMGSAKYPDSSLGLRRSATCGYMPHHHTFAPMKGDFCEPSHLLNGRLPITNGKAESVEEEDDALKAKLTIQGVGVRGDVSPPEESGKKTRDYSDDSLTPDSSLPAVIRRRNRNRRKKLAVSTDHLFARLPPLATRVFPFCMCLRSSISLLFKLNKLREAESSCFIIS